MSFFKKRWLDDALLLKKRLHNAFFHENVTKCPFLRKVGWMTSFLLVWSAIDKRAAVRTASPAIEACVKRWHAHLYTFLYYYY